MSGRPWFKLYRRRSARFEALPMIARGLFNEILAAADEDGWLRLGTADRSALWRHVGAHPGERRALSKHLDALIELGAVEETGEGWSIPSFDEDQSMALDGYVYLIGAVTDPHRHPIKVGWSQRPAARLRSLQTGNPVALCVVLAIPGTQVTERFVHSQLADRLEGEWFGPAAFWPARRTMETLAQGGAFKGATE